MNWKPTLRPRHELRPRVLEYLRDHPEASDREVAAEFGLKNHKSVGRWRKEKKIEAAVRKGKDGVLRQLPRKKREVLMQELSRIAERLERIEQEVKAATSARWVRGIGLDEGWAVLRRINRSATGLQVGLAALHSKKAE